MIFSLLGISLHKKNEIICLWYYPREMKSYVDKDIYMNVHISFISKNPKLETTQMSTNKWMNNLVYPYHEMLISEKKWTTT